jgi:dolichol-phosphate mannosyltransferase
MAQVSLIVLDRPECPPADPRFDSWREALTAAGHDVEMIVVGARAIASHSAIRHLPTRDLGLSTDAIDGLRTARGDIRLIVDSARHYETADFLRLIEPLADGRAEVAVAAVKQVGWRAMAAAALRPIAGSSDPFAGLIGLTRAAFNRTDGELKPVGRRFAFEILARANRNRLDVAVQAARASHFPNFSLDDLRQIKRLSDDKLGNVSRLIQFCVVGASGMVVDLSLYALFQLLFRLTPLATMKLPFDTPADLAAAGALAIGLALTWNFTLNRYLTFSYAKKGSLVRQFVTYVLSNALGIALSFTLRLSLPKSFVFFAEHKLAAAVVGIVAATGISFTMSRWLVFRHRPDLDQSAAPLVPDASSGTV